MKKIVKIVLIAAALIVASRQARAGVHLDLDFENLYSVDTLTLAPANGTVVLLASTLDSSFGNLTLATTTFTDPAQTDDIVLGKWAISPAGVLQNAVDFNLTGNLNAGDKMLMVWYPNVTFSGGLTGPGYSKSFGTYRSDTASFASDIGFIVPADGSSFALSALTTGGPGGDLAPSLFVANQSTIAVVPEPSSIALVAIGCVGALMVRRRKLARS